MWIFKFFFIKPEMAGAIKFGGLAVKKKKALRFELKVM